MSASYTFGLYVRPLSRIRPRCVVCPSGFCSIFRFLIVDLFNGVKQVHNLPTDWTKSDWLVPVDSQEIIMQRGVKSSDFYIF